MEENIECPVFVAGELATHKLGFKALVFGVTKELRNEQGTVVQELAPEEFIYLIGYLDNSGKVELLKVNHPVLEKYVG